jgi:TetR/AcrR family transcriptional repressor of nem operon
MRYEKGHKSETRRRIVETASRRFRKDGIAATGIAGLMAEAGLTHGGFYAHFPSKDDLVRGAVEAALQNRREDLIAAIGKARANGRNGLEAIVGRYLHAAHRDHPEDGCAIAALAPELARAPAGPREALVRETEALIDVIAGEVSAASPEAARATATAVLGLMVGTLQMARATPDRAASDAMLASGRSAALLLGRSAAG